ncbi:MAG TPA: sulfocyanin-like copper-binding protein [Acidimicrobiales bacterium]|nr:sulfocyanin-like copper-binding protein [Acidimicrobiales bacterium]
MTAPPHAAEVDRPATEHAPGRRRRVVALVAIAVLAAGGLGTGLAIAVGGSSPATSTYSYYESMMGRYDLGSSSMMGGGSSYGWMMGSSGYGWMMGGTNAPGWMHGSSLPGFMMGSSTDPGKVMGRLFADAPGPRVSPSEAAAFGNQIPRGAVVDRSANRVTFTTSPVNMAVVASPAANPDETFRVAGLVNPTLVVPRGAKVTVTFVNADPDTAHGMVVTTTGTSSKWMPMMTASPAFPGSALWFLGNPTPAGMHSGTLHFTADAPGTFEYLCPVPGHAQKGMFGSFIVGS